MTRRLNNPQAAKNLKPFKKGKGADIDPRINTKGRPKSFDQLRALFQEIAAEEVSDGKKTVTRVEYIGRMMAADKKLMKEFLEFAFGKVPQNVDIKGKVGVYEVDIESDDDGENENQD